MSLLLRRLGDAEFFFIACSPTFSPQQAECSRSAVLQVWRSQSLCQRLSAARGPIMKSAPGDTLLSVPTTRTCRIKVSRKLSKGREASTTLSPHKLEEVLPVMKVKVNRMDRIALVDSGCSSSVVSGMLCRPEVWKNTVILTAGRKCLLSHGVGSITLTVTNRNPLKTPHGWCTTKYKVGRVTGITSAQNITVDRNPHNVKDLRPIVESGQPTVCSEMVSEDASERFVTIRERPCEQAPSTNAGDASSNNTSDEDQVTILPQRSTRRKRPPPECFMCDHRIGGGGSSNATNNLTSKKQKVCSLCYRHMETWSKKETKFEEEKRSILLMSDWWTSSSLFCVLDNLTTPQ